MPCTFRHLENNVNIVMHVEDIFAVENEVVLQWVTEQLKKQDDLQEQDDRSKRALGNVRKLSLESH